MPGLLSVLNRCIHSQFFDIHFSPGRFKFMCSSLGFFLFITLRESGFDIDYNNGVVFIKYNLPKSQKFELYNKYLLTYDIYLSGNYRDSKVAKHVEIFYDLYRQLVDGYVYPVLSSIKSSQIQVKECSDYLIDSNVGKLVSYPYIDFHMDDTFYFNVISYRYNPSTSKLTTSMFNELKKFDCTYPRRNIMKFMRYAKSLL